MPEVPKIVHSRLRAGAPDVGHPDPDLLAAFAEQALSPDEERESILRHLAVCGDCREVIAIALPASESVPVPQRAPEEEETAAPVRARPRTNWFGWLGLRGAAVAAGVLVVASVLILRPGKATQPKVESNVENTVASVNTQAEPARTETAAAKPAAPSIEPRLTASLKSGEVLDRRANEEQSKLESQFSKELKIATPPKQTEMARMQPEVVLGDRKRADLDSADKRSEPAPATAGAMSGRSVSEAAAAPAASVPQPQPAANAVSVGAASESVTVNASAGQVETDAVTTNEKPGLMARNVASAPIQKAKAAAKDEDARAMSSTRTKKQASGASSNYAVAYERAAQALSTTWQLSEGALQHSWDAGSSWQTVLRPDHPLLCHAVRGTDIWAGGKAGTVFHSSDGGTTWTQLHPAVKDQPLTADITAIQAGKPGQIILTAGGASWITMDNGKTWTKK